MLKNTIRAFFTGAVLVAAAVATTPEASAGGNSWGWSKPINQRMGAFYTSNRAFHKKHKTTSHGSGNRHHQWSNRSSSPYKFHYNPKFYRPFPGHSFHGFHFHHGYHR